MSRLGALTILRVAHSVLIVQVLSYLHLALGDFRALAATRRVTV